MRQVSKEEFDNFLKDRRYKIEQGAWVHSTLYVDADTRERIAFKETSSYNMDIVYLIEE